MPLHKGWGHYIGVTVSLVIVSLIRCVCVNCMAYTPSFMRPRYETCGP